MEELSFRIDHLAIVVWASLLLVKFLLLPLIEKYLLSDASEHSVTRFRFWSTLLSWLPVFWLWFYVLGQTITFSVGLIIWTLVGVATVGLLGTFNASSDQTSLEKVAPKENLLYALSTQICLITIIYVLLRYFGVIPYAYGGIFIAVLAVILVLSATRSKIATKDETTSSEIDPASESIKSESIKPSTVEKFAYSFATGLTTSSPIQSSSYYISPIGFGKYSRSYSAGVDLEGLFGCLLGLILGIPALVFAIVLLAANIVLVAPVVLLQIAIFISMIILLIPLSIPIFIFKDYLKIAVCLIYVALLPNLIADENLYTIATWVGLPVLFGFPLLILSMKVISRISSSAILAVVGVVWAFIILLSGSIFFLYVKNIKIIIGITSIFAIILILIGLKHGLRVRQLLVPMLILAFVGIEGVPRLETKRFLKQAEDRIRAGHIQDASDSLEGADRLIKEYENFIDAFRLPKYFKVVPSLQSTKAYLLKAKVSIQEGDYSKAISYLREVEIRHSKYLSKNAKINNALLQAELYLSLGKKARQEEMINKALMEAGKTFNLPYWTAHINRYKARFEMERGQHEKAIRILKDVKKVGQRIGSYKLISSALAGLGDAYFREGKYSKAERYYSDALKLSRRLNACGDEALYFLRLAKAEEKMGNLDVALRNLFKAVRLSRQISFHEVLWQARYQQGLILEGQGKHNDAFKCYTEAVSIIEKVRGRLHQEEYRLGYMASKLPVYDHAVSAAYQMGKSDSAFTFAQKGKSRVLLDLLGTRMVAFHKQDIKLAEKERFLQIKINALLERVSEEGLKPQRLQSGKLKKWKKELQKAIEEHEDILAKIKRTNPRLASLTTARTYNLSDVQKVLHRDELFLEYFVLDNRTLLWAVTSKDAKTFQIPLGRVKLNSLVSNIYKQINGAYTPSVSNLNKGYRTLLSPVSRYLRKKAHLIIAPHDKLYFLPFEALVVEKASPTYVVDRWFVSYYPSASILVLNRKYEKKKPIPEKALFAIGDPVFSPSDSRCSRTNIKLAMANEKGGALYKRVWMNRSFEPVTKKPKSTVFFPRLVNTAKEVRTIGLLWGVSARNGDINIGLNATEKEVKSVDHTKYRYEHYATHGVLRGDIPGLKEPALVLSFPNPKDPAEDEGFLTMSDIFRLRTNAEMVVLSACKTALGEEVPGEGLIGLTRAFMYAGTPSVVASLWSVSDASTAKLMTLYYTYLKQGNDKAKALSLAKRKLRKQGYYNPFYWAPFILMGER